MDKILLHRAVHGDMTQSIVSVIHKGVCGIARLTCGGTCDSQIGFFSVHAFLAVTFALSGVPMLVDFIIRVSKFSLDTHVLMALAVIGSVLLGLPHEVSEKQEQCFGNLFLTKRHDLLKIVLQHLHSQQYPNFEAHSRTSQKIMKN